MEICTCGPYPTVDLTPAFDAAHQAVTKPNDEKFKLNNRKLAGLQHEVKRACERFGCFHVSINTRSSSFFKNNNHQCQTEGQHQQYASSLCNLVDEEVVVDVIESLFEDHFISSEVIANQCKNDNSAVSSVRFQCAAEGKRHLMAKYRGRSAESGRSTALLDSKGKHQKILRGEPKQSWEFFRCSKLLPQEENESILKNDKNTAARNRLEVLQDYTYALHSVAEVIFSPLVLNLPRETFIGTTKCQCDHIDDNLSSQESVLPTSSTISGQCNKSCCSIDLLRVFRYDSQESSEEQLTNLGSSSHTDWGSLTVVWQDSKGGLQIKCHLHDCWNDVELTPHDTSCENNNGGDDKGVVRLFIHVGDFLSLAINGSSNESLTYPSPLHRVLCPLQAAGEENIEIQKDRVTDSRCSLVYFAYPPPGISLRKSQASVLSKQHVNNNHSDCVADLPPDKYSLDNRFPFRRFMLLHDQSSKPTTLTKDEKHGPTVVKGVEDESNANIIYNRIHSLPFDDVIREKWSQVQR